jgi:hypothetical protein
VKQGFPVFTKTGRNNQPLERFLQRLQGEFLQFALIISPSPQKCCAFGLIYYYQTPDGQRIGVHNDSGLWTVVLFAPGDLAYAPRIRVNDLGTTTFELPSGALRVVDSCRSPRFPRPPDWVGHRPARVG